MGRIRSKKLTGRKSPRGRKRPPGLPPGTFLGNPDAPRPKLHLFRYDETSLHERTVESLDKLDPLLPDDGRFLWLHVEGLGDVEAIRTIAERFELPPLSRESERLRSKFSLVLTGRAPIATIFIPLSFVAGLYGMNFSTEISAWNMPELGWRYGYPFALGVMAFVTALFLVYFWRKGWFR